MLRVSLPASGSDSESEPRCVAGGEAGQPPLLLLLGAEAGDDRRRDGVRVEDAGHAHPSVRDLLDHPDVGEEVEPEAAVLLGDGDAEQAHRLHLLHEPVRVLVGVLERRTRSA